MSKQDKVDQYKQVDLTSRIENASPHQLIQMLFEGALGSLTDARAAMARDDIEARGLMISKAVNIIAGLRDSLNLDVKDELPYELDRLYEYMQRRVMQAHSDNDEQALEEVVELLLTLKSGWDGISPR